jgi:cytochrome c-type biogenesis protein CcmH
MKQLVFMMLLGFSAFVGAAVEYRDFKEPEQEKIYQSLISELRCLVCQNQTIADSNADLAKDLRRQVYEMVQQGQSRQQIVDFMTQRYGDFVLYRPALNLKTALLWLGPILFLLIGLFYLFLIISAKKSTQPASLTPEQQQKLNDLLEKGDRN